MADTKIEDGHHVVRHCRARLLDTSVPNSPEVFPQAFNLRKKPKQEKYLSCSYYEFFQGAHLKRMRDALDATKARFPQIKNDDAMLMINAGEIRKCGLARKYDVRVVHQPRGGSKDYAGIRGIPEKDDLELGALLCALAVRDIILVGDIP